MLVQSVLFFVIVELARQVSSQRLVATVTPFSYDVILLPILTKSPRLCGHVYLDVEARNATNLIHFHAVDLDLLEATFEPLMIPGRYNNQRIQQQRLDRVEEICFDRMLTSSSSISSDGSVRSLTKDSERQEWTALLSQAMVPGRLYRLGILYTGKIYDVSKGFFRGKYSLQNSCCER